MLETGKQHIKDMVNMNLQLYIDGGKVVRPDIISHSKERPMINAIAETYDMQHEKDLQELLQCKSHLTGSPKVNRWSYIREMHRNCAGLSSKTWILSHRPDVK